MRISSKQFDKIQDVQVWLFQFLCRNFIGKGPALKIRVLLNLLLLEKKIRNTGRYTNTSKTVILSSFYQDSIFSFKQDVNLGEENLQQIGKQCTVCCMLGRL